MPSEIPPFFIGCDGIMPEGAGQPPKKKPAWLAGFRSFLASLGSVFGASGRNLKNRQKPLLTTDQLVCVSGVPPFVPPDGVCCVLRKPIAHPYFTSHSPNLPAYRWRCAPPQSCIDSAVFSTHSCDVSISSAFLYSQERHLSRAPLFEPPQTGHAQPSPHFPPVSICSSPYQQQCFAATE